MKNNTAIKIISIILFAVILAGLMSPANFCITAEAASSDVENLIDDILKWKHDGSAQSVLDDISSDMGSGVADWYAISLSQYKYDLDFSSCKNSLDSYIASMNHIRATDKQRIAIAYTSMGYNESVNDALNNSIGELGIMSYIYGLIMLDCGGYHGNISRDEIINKILSLQSSDGGWGLMQNSDVDVTAMAVQSLARYYKHSDVKLAINKALDYLSKRQQRNGCYKSYGTESAESTAQVLIALNSMRINYKTDSRFVKHGNTVYDGLLNFRKGDGSFSHTLNGNTNQLATVQVLCSLISLWRYESGKSSFFEFVNNNIERETSNNPINKPSSSKPSENSNHSNPNITSQGNNSSSIISRNISNYSNTTNNNENSNINDTSKTQQNLNSTSNPNRSDTQSRLSEASQRAGENFSEIVSTPENKTNNDYNLSDKVESENKSQDVSEFSEIIQSAQSIDLNFIIALCIAGIFCVILVIFIIKKKINRKNLIVIILLFTVLITVAFTIKIETPSQYYNEISDYSKVESGRVTVSISCKNAIGKSDNNKIPPDGIILNNTEFSIEDGDTAFNVLLKAAKKNRIQIDYDGGGNNNYELVYVKGISYLYEFDCGELSGWMYKINGKVQNVGCSSYKLKDGDIIEWVYTTNIGKDID